jgi:hypothetical protein
MNRTSKQANKQTNIQGKNSAQNCPHSLTQDSLSSVYKIIILESGAISVMDRPERNDVWAQRKR